MADPTGTTTSLSKLEDWQPAFDVHAKRYAGVVERHAKYMTQFVDALRLYPVGSFELNVIMEQLSKDLRNTAEEAYESMESLQSDIIGLKDIFEFFQKELEKTHNDTP